MNALALFGLASKSELDALKVEVAQLKETILDSRYTDLETNSEVLAGVAEAGNGELEDFDPGEMADILNSGEKT